VNLDIFKGKLVAALVVYNFYGNEMPQTVLHSGLKWPELGDEGIPFLWVRFVLFIVLILSETS
jgi:hypothetical protein